MNSIACLPARRRVLGAAVAALFAGGVLAFSPYGAPAMAQTSAPDAPQVAPAAPPQPSPHVAHGPASVADLAEGLLDAVVNISTSQTVKGTEGQGAVPMPQLPEGSPFQDFFDDFFKDRQGGDEDGGAQKVQSLGSGFVVDADRASSSPTTTSSPMPTRSRSISPTAPS